MIPTHLNKFKSHTEFIWRPSIRTYLILMNFTLLCLLFPSISFVFLKEQTEFRDAQLTRTIFQMRRSLEERSASLSSNMALSINQAIAGYDFTFLNIMVNQVVNDDPDIVYCIIMGPDRKAMVHSDPQKTGSILEDRIDYQVSVMLKNVFLPTSYGGPGAYSVRFIDREPEPGSENGQVMEAVVPVYNGSRLWGALRCGYSLKRLHKGIEAHKQEWALKMQKFKKNLLSITVIFFSMGVVAAFFFTRFFVRSMHALSEGVNRVSEGNLDQDIRQQGFACVEFLKLSEAFNEMTVKLKTSYQKLDEYSKSLEYKVAERTRELKDAQDNLLQQAHEAGMAEMAVGILHNIGNAITPTKVGASLLLKELRESPARNNLNGAMNNIHNVVAESVSISPEEKRRLLAIIELIPENIREQYDKVIDKIQQIQIKHEHIEEIIRLQMRYAQISGSLEEVDINRLCEDALNMLGDSISRRSVTVITKFSKIPFVKIEKAKLMQILVNLIKNAYEAMENVDSEKRSILISSRLEEGSPAFVMLSIRDSGIGIPDNEKEKLFSFGYTSKIKGSGFGLHSSANFLKANNGSITAHSEGPGSGAEFTVRLPVNGSGHFDQEDTISA